MMCGDWIQQQSQVRTQWNGTHTHTHTHTHTFLCAYIHQYIHRCDDTLEWSMQDCNKYFFVITITWVVYATWFEWRGFVQWRLSWRRTVTLFAIWRQAATATSPSNRLKLLIDAVCGMYAEFECAPPWEGWSAPLPTLIYPLHSTIKRHCIREPQLGGVVRPTPYPP